MKNIYEGLANVIEITRTNNREPIWDQAIKHLVSECAMESTVRDTLTQGFIQEIILEQSPHADIWSLFHDFGRWAIQQDITERKQRLLQGHPGLSPFTPSCKGNEIWLAYLMSTQYAREWDGENWGVIM